MGKRSRNSIEIMHAALTDSVARAVFGHLSPDDLDVLANRAKRAELTEALMPLDDHDDVNHAVAAMPEDVGGILNKLPPDVLGGVKSQFNALALDGDPANCKCQGNA